MLWDIIRDWFVQYVWGGVTSNNQSFGGLVGQFLSEDGQTSDTIFTNGFYVGLKGYAEYDYTIFNPYISIGDWLSTMCTILVLGALILFLFFVVRYLFRLTSGLIRGR